VRVLVNTFTNILLQLVFVISSAKLFCSFQSTVSHWVTSSIIHHPHSVLAMLQNRVAKMN